MLRIWQVGLLVWALVATSAMAQEVTVPSGRVVGQAMDDGSLVFHAIPFASAPTGVLRWKPPAPAPKWSGVRDATRPGAPCVQGDEGWNGPQVASGREDCLTVSIRTPAKQPGPLPVLVYIHGGSNSAGDSGGLEEDTLHRHGVVVVKIQYRLGVFGFLGLSALREENPDQASGNYALLDQIAALRWVKANIARFGGDADNVTISGNSAGGTNVLFLTQSPLTKGLFNKAIVQSAAPGAPRTALENEQIGNLMLQRLKLPLGREGLAQLRQMPARDVIAAAVNLPTPPGVDPSFIWEQQILDGHVMRDTMSDAYAKGAGRDVAIIIGSNRQELGSQRDPAIGRTLIASAFGSRVQDALPLYGYGDGDASASAADPLLGSVPVQLITDMWFRCPANWLAQRALTVTSRVWQYEFGFGWHGSGKPPSHTSEMNYVFRSPPASATQNDWPPVQQYWVNFIRTSTPNGPGLPQWPAAGENAAYLSIEPAGLTVKHRLRSEVCDLMYQDRDYPQSAVVIK